MPSLSDIQNRQQSLIRKGLEGSVFIKRYDPDDAEITKLTDGSGLLALPAGYEDAGMVTKDDGVSWTRDVDSSDTTSWGSSEPTRRDIVSDVSGLAFTMQETNRQSLQLYHGIDLSAATYDSNGEVSFDKPDRPATLYYRVLVIGKDGEGADAIYFARWLPRASVTDMSEQSWQEGEEIRYGVTLTAYNDSTVGTSMREFWAQPTSVADAMGFTAGT